MTVKELIEKLQGMPQDADVVFRDENVANCPLVGVECMEAYWDGRLERLLYDRSGKYPKITGAAYVVSGMKVVLNGYNVESLIFDDPDAHVEMPFSLKDAEWMGSLEEVYNRNERFYSQVERWREESREMWKQINSYCEKEQAKKKAELMKERLEE